MRKSCSIYIDVEIGLFVFNYFMSAVFTKQLGHHCHARCLSTSFSVVCGEALMFLHPGPQISCLFTFAGPLFNSPE